MSTISILSTLNDHPTVVSACAVGAALLFGLWRLWLRPLLEAKRPPGLEGVNMASPTHWLLGHLQLLNGDCHIQHKQLVVDSADEEYGRTCFWIVRKPALAVLDWRDARTLLQAEYARDRIPIVDKHFNQILGQNNIGVMRGREWKYHRAAVVRSFTPSSLVASSEAMLEVTETMVSSLRARIKLSETKCYEGPVEPLMKMITLDVFGKAAFSVDFGCCETLVPSPIASSFSLLSSEVSRRLRTNPIKPSNYFYWIPTVENLKCRQAQHTLRIFVHAAIAQRREPSAKHKHDLLANLLDAHHVAKREVGYRDDDVSSATLSDVIVTLAFAGFDTTAITLSYALGLASQNPSVESACLEEIQSMSVSSNVDRAKSLVYCTAVLKETLRLYPPGPITSRTLQKPVALRGGLIAPAGIDVSIPIWHIHRHERNFPRPDDFLPERWVKKNKGTGNWVDREDEDTRSGIPVGNHNAFFAFSGGARSCPGMKFAWQEAVLVFAGLLKDLKFSALPGYTLQPERDGLVQHPSGGLPMKITVRDNESAVA